MDQTAVRKSFSLKMAIISWGSLDGLPTLLHIQKCGTLVYEVHITTFLASLSDERAYSVPVSIQEY